MHHDAVRVADRRRGRGERGRVAVEQHQIETALGDLAGVRGAEADGGTSDERARTVARAKIGRGGHARSSHARTPRFNIRAERGSPGPSRRRTPRAHPGAPRRAPTGLETRARYPFGTLAY